jgi:FkbM family methyltransferase
MQKYLNKLRKISFYLLKLACYPNIFTIGKFLQHVKPKHRLPALAAYLDKRPIAVECKHNLEVQDLNVFLKIYQYQIRRMYDRFYLWEYKGVQYCATFVQFWGLYHEYLSGIFDEIYSLDWHDKRVLDIGGYVGDSALYFLTHGAQSVVIYEPIPDNIFSMHYNLAPYKEKIEIYQKAVAFAEGDLRVCSQFPAGSLGFGVEQGEYEVKCQGITFHTILQKHAIDVAKVDCEGGEEHLLAVSKENLQTIPYWIIETHRLSLKKQIEDKFQQSNFIKIKEHQCAEQVHLLSFQLSTAPSPAQQSN